MGQKHKTYQYNNSNAEKMFYDLARRLMNDEIDYEDMYPEMTKILEMEPGLEDPDFFYYYGKALKAKGDQESAYLAFKKSLFLQEKYPTFEINFLLGYFVNKEMAEYEFFEKVEKTDDLNEKLEAHLAARSHLNEALKFHIPDDEEYEVIKEVIRRCDEFKKSI